MRYSHVKCKCGGIIGQYERKVGFICEICKKQYEMCNLKFDILFKNEMTGWIFPMVERKDEK